MYDIQRFLNRLHTSMAAHIVGTDSVNESIVATWEDEFEMLRPLLHRPDLGTSTVPATPLLSFSRQTPPTPLPFLLSPETSRFLLLAAQQEVQAYYFIHPPNAPGHNLAVNVTRAFNTARNIIAAATDLEASSRFLNHGPHWAYRTVFDAACLIISTLHSSLAPTALSAAVNGLADTDDTAAAASLLVQQAIAATTAYSTVEGDLPSRGAAIIDAFWSVRAAVPLFEGPPTAWANRLGASITFASLHRFKAALQESQKSSEIAAAARGLEAIRKSSSLANASSLYQTEYTC
jgi:transcriptional regulatory protein LEU3